MDYAYEQTEETLAELEKRIREIYGGASDEIQQIVDEYFEGLKSRDDHQRQLLEAGQITKEQYQLWRLAQIGRGERYEALRDAVAKRCSAANQVALSYVNDTTPGIYSLNYNYQAYTIEKVHGNVGFTLFDEQTVRRLIAEDPQILPKSRLDIPRDLQWNKDKMKRELVSGIMLGDSTGQLADRLQRVTDMNRASALRNARTSLTHAQNAGRQESMLRAKEMGIRQKKQWIAAKDMRTRHSHGMLDRQTVEVDEFFITENGSKLLFPGDSAHDAEPCDVYNCRCAMVTIDPAVNSDGDYETYQEWYDRKFGNNPGAFETERKRVVNAASDREQFERYSNILGENAPKTFAEFQDLKYNNPDKWEKLKYQYRTINRYEVTGGVSVNKILELDDAAWTTKQNGFDCSGYTGKNRTRVKNMARSGNAAVLDFNGTTYFAHSRAAFTGTAEYDSYVGTYPLIGLEESRRFSVLNLGDTIGRENDTEAKFFEFVARQIEPETKTTITILSEKHICASCTYVMQQFQKEYPNVTINVISGKRNYNGSREGLKTWEHRKRS